MQIQTSWVQVTTRRRTPCPIRHYCSNEASSFLITASSCRARLTNHHHRPNPKEYLAAVSTAAIAAELIQYPRLLPPLTQILHLGTRCAVAGLLCRIISSSSPSHFISRACATSLRWGTSTTNNNLLSGLLLNAACVVVGGGNR